MLLACFSAKGQNATNAYEFLGIPVSARSAAVGGQNISLAEDDITLIYTNPALLSNVSTNTLNLDVTSYIASTNKLSATFARQAGEHATWAVGAQYLSYGNIDETDETGTQRGRFSPSDVSLQGTFAYIMSEYWSGGVTAKMLYSKYGNYSAFALGVDLGINYYHEENGLSLSLTGRNFGGQIKPLYQTRESLPFNLAFGISKNLGHAPVRINITFDDLTHWHKVNFIQHCILGADFSLGKIIWLGLGYSFRQSHEMKTADGSSHLAGLNFGAGINVKKFKFGFAWGRYHIAANSLVFNASLAL